MLIVNLAHGTFYALGVRFRLAVGRRSAARCGDRSACRLFLLLPPVLSPSPRGRVLEPNCCAALPGVRRNSPAPHFGLLMILEDAMKLFRVRRSPPAPIWTQGAPHSAAALSRYNLGRLVLLASLALWWFIYAAFSRDPLSTSQIAAWQPRSRQAAASNPGLRHRCFMGGLAALFRARAGSGARHGVDACPGVRGHRDRRPRQSECALVGA